MKEIVQTDKQIIQTLARTFDRFSDPITITAMDSRFLYVNLPVVKFFGLRIPAEMKEKYYEEVKAPIFENEQTIQAWKDQDQYLLNNPDKNLRMLEVHPNGVSCPFIDKKFLFTMKITSV